MTEQEWQRCADPMPMLEFLQDKASQRKLRLVACACCYRLWHLLVDSRKRPPTQPRGRPDFSQIGSAAKAD